MGWETVGALCLAVLALVRGHDDTLVTNGVDLSSFLARADPVFAWSPSSPASEWTHSIFGGNGALGFMAFSPPEASSSELIVWVSRQDVYDDRNSTLGSVFTHNFALDTPRLPIGSLRVSFSGKVARVDGRTCLRTGTSHLNISTSNGTATLTLFANADYTVVDVIAFNAASQDESVAVSFEPAIASSTWAPKDPSYIPNPKVEVSTVGGVTTATQRHLIGTAHSSVLAQQHGEQTFFFAVSSVEASPAESDAAAQHQVKAALDVGWDSLRLRHETVWNDFWTQSSLITMQETVWESFYLIQAFKFNSAVRRDGKGIPHDLEGTWFIPGTPWPDLHWDMNLQQTYYFPIAAGYQDLSATLVDFLNLDTVRTALANNPPPDWTDAMAAPTGASALLGPAETCYWNYGPNCTTSPPSVTGNLLWTLQLVTMHADYTQQHDVLVDTVLPLLKGALTFASHLHDTSSPSGSIGLVETFSPEWPTGPGPNASYDLALYRWGLETALKIAESTGQGSEMVDEWKDVLARLHLPFVDPATGYMIYSNKTYDQPHRHYSHLFQLFPLRHLDLTASDNHTIAATSLDTFLATPETDSLFYRPAAAAINVALGRPLAAISNISFLVVESGRVENNTFYREGAQGSCTETPYAAAWAMTDLLVHCGGRAAGVGREDDIVLFPGVPSVIDVSAGGEALVAASVAVSGFYNLVVAGGRRVSAMRHVTSSNSTHVTTAVTWAAVTSPTMDYVVFQTDMPRPLAAYPQDVKLHEVGGDRVAVFPNTNNQTIVVYPASSGLKPPFVFKASAGQPENFNYWGYRSV